jgi:dienelactone hydrolase
MTMEIQMEGVASDASFDFTVRVGADTIPATFWNGRAPEGGKPALTLLQHGGPFHKRHERSDQLAIEVVAQTGSAVLLIDGPIHGLRRQDEPSIEEMLGNFERHWKETPGIDAYVSDWQTVLDVVLQQGWADPHRIAWLGMSMGTAYGIPLCAVENRIKVAAMGMWGIDWGQDSRLLADARRMRTSVLFQIKSEDEIFSIQGQRALFDALGSPNKTLHTHAGGHSLTAPGQLQDIMDFIASGLARVQQQPGEPVRRAGQHEQSVTVK